MAKYRIYEKIDGHYVLINGEADKEKADSHESKNRVLIIQELADRDETYKLMFEKYRNKEEEEFER